MRTVLPMKPLKISCRRGNRRVDMVLLTEELTRMKKLDEVGGINYIAELTNDAMSSFNVEEHARIVAEKSTLRRLIDAGNRIVGESYNGGQKQCRTF